MVLLLNQKEWCQHCLFLHYPFIFFLDLFFNLTFSSSSSKLCHHLSPGRNTAEYDRIYPNHQQVLYKDKTPLILTYLLTTAIPETHMLSILMHLTKNYRTTSENVYDLSHVTIDVEVIHCHFLENLTRGGIINTGDGIGFSIGIGV